MSTSAPAFSLFRGEFGSRAYPVGRVTAKRDVTLRNRGFETASWYEDVTIPAGATATLWHNGGFYGAGCTFEGTITASHFPSSFGGVSYGPNPNDAKRIGTPGSIGHGFAHSVVADGGDEDFAITLAPEYRVVENDEGRHVWETTGHPLVVTRLRTVRDGSHYGTHHYGWSWRGEDRGTFTVEGARGFNGDTSRVAMRDAVALLVAGGC